MMDILIYVFCWMYALISLEYRPRNGISGSWSRCLSLANTPQIEQIYTHVQTVFKQHGNLSHWSDGAYG